MAYKGIEKAKRDPNHPDHLKVIKKNKIDYLMNYTN